MSLPYVVSEAVWTAKDEDETKVLKTDFERCKVVVIEITTTAFTGTIDIQGKLHELSAYSNVPYIRQGQASIQTPSVAQIVPDIDTGVYRYVVLGYWRRLQIVMTCTNGTITCGVAGSSDAILFPYLLTKLLANSGVDIGDVDILSTTITKTIQTELLAITKVAANAQQKSSELALTNMKKVTILIDHGRTATTAFVVAGTEYRIEASQKASGDDTWRTIASVEAIITAAIEITAAGAEAIGQTLIACGDPEPAVNDIVFWENATLASSEWMKVVARVDNTSFTIQDGLTNAQATAKKIYNKAEQFVLTLDVTAFTRLRVIVNNNNGTTNAQVASRIAAITQL